MVWDTPSSDMRLVFAYSVIYHDLTDIRYHIIMAKDQKKEVGSNQARFLKGALNGGHCMALRYIVSEGLREMR